MVKDSYGKTVKVKVSNCPPKNPKKQNKTKSEKFYLSVIHSLCFEKKTVGKKGYIMLAEKD